jgi:hypothetical protein
VAHAPAATSVTKRKIRIKNYPERTRLTPVASFFAEFDRRPICVLN